ncbi:hypothetical protein FDT66_10920 [Polaribacter aestuariivivens]|uniref:Uncharacterized protein n=1 Tax=Polaribacter aestuariivivens TaxID=2304626 RepID=A0A5S3N2P5_9FLAO|nr:hypothetical protein [Polaribacter aestuariivivens]TMM29618.1 hypothetical protein FDT66_10920 [Polaribacter aestuariivivens]
MYLIFTALFFLIIWIVSIYVLSYWKQFFRFLLLNTFLVAFYLYVIIFYGKNIWGHDEYGLGALGRIILSFMFHTITVFIFSIYKSYQLKKDEKAT